MTGGEISGNNALENGGGVYVNSGGLFTMSGGAKITGNTAVNGGGVYTQDNSNADPIADVKNVYKNIGVAYDAIDPNNNAVISGNTATAGASMPPVNAADFALRAANPFDGGLLDNDNIGYTNTDYRIHYRTNGGGAVWHVQFLSTQTLNTLTVSAAGFTAPAVAPIFIGWNTAPDGSGTSYAPNQNVNLATVSENRGLTLYAQW
jgi:hypothetical protein